MKGFMQQYTCNTLKVLNSRWRSKFRNVETSAKNVNSDNKVSNK